MNNTDQIKAFFSMFVTQFPILLVCLAAVIVIVAKWNLASRGSMWALLGFGLTLILCIAIPVVQTVVQSWVIQNVETIAQRASFFAGLSILWSVLRALTYALLLVAVFAGRSASPSAPRPPLSRNESTRVA